MRCAASSSGSSTATRLPCVIPQIAGMTPMMISVADHQNEKPNMRASGKNHLSESIGVLVLVTVGSAPTARIAWPDRLRRTSRVPPNS